MNGSAAYFDAVDTSVMDQVMCYSPSWGSIEALKLVYAEFDLVQQGEIDRLNTSTISGASFFVPSLPSNQVYTSAPFTTASTYINCAPTAGAGCNAVSAGQYVSSVGTYFTGGTYVTSVINSFTPGSGNQPTATQINLSTSPTANNSGGLSVNFVGQIVPVRWGGNKSVALSPSHDVVTSDATTIQIPPSTQYFVRTAATMSGAGMQISDYPGGARFTGAQNEFDSRGASLNDHTADPTNISNSGGGFWSPVAVLGLVTPNAGFSPPGAVLILGDSIAAGTGDVPDSLYLQGYIQRSLENNVPFVTAARGSTTASEEAVQGAGQLALATDTGITDVLLELGRNDIQQFSATANSLEGYVSTIAARYNKIGKRVWCFTIPPTTVSADGWTTLGYQSWIVTSTVASAAAPAGASALVLSNSSGVSVGQSVVLPPPTQAVAAMPVPVGSVTLTLQSTGGLYTGQAVYGPGIAAGSTITGIAGTVLTISAPTSAVVPAYSMLAFGTGISPGTTVTAVNYTSNTISLSAPISAAIPSGSTIYTGNGTPNSNEATREVYNSYLRTSAGRAAMGCYGLVDDDAVMADPGGSFKWRVDLGPASVDGVHPAASIHGAVVASGAINAGLFIPP